MMVPFLVFFLLLVLGREELGLRGCLIAVGIWAALLLGIFVFQGSVYLFVAAQALLDVVLILLVFGGDIRVR